MGKGNAIPLRWMAPEVLKFTNTLKFSEASDVWAYGMTIWEIYTLGELPFFEFNLSEVRVQILQGVTPIVPEHCPPIIKDIMAHCWNFNPRERWSFDKIVSKTKEHDEKDHQFYSIPMEASDILLTKNSTKYQRKCC